MKQYMEDMGLLLVVICVSGAVCYSGLIRKNIFVQKMHRKISQNLDNDDFEYIYEQIMNKANLEEVKQEYNKNLKKFVMGHSLIILGILALYVALVDCRSGVNPIIFFLILFYGVCVFSAKKLLVVKEAGIYKKEIIQNLILSICSNACYKEKKANSVYEDIYENAGFKDSMSNCPKASEYMEFGTDNGSKVSLANLLLQYCSYGRYGSKTVHDVFAGIAVKLTRDKVIKNEILIQRNTVFKHFNRIKNNNETFEKYFDVYVRIKDNIDKVITEQSKVALVELYEKYGIMFEVSIKHNLIFIRFFTGHLFENKRLSMLNKKQLYREYIIFKSILQIINKIDEIF